MRTCLAFFSRVINRATGGGWEPLCLRVARAHGPDCRFCRLVATVLREPWHCRDLMTVDDVVAWLRRKTR